MEILTKEIKNEFKKAGFDMKKVSVRHRWAGYSESYDIELKDRNMDIQKAREIARKFREVDRDEVTGEVLLGGNTYVFVQYSYDC